MDAATAVIIGAIIGASASLLAGVIVPLIAEAVKLRFETNRVRINGVKAIVPLLLEVATGNIQRRAVGDALVPPTPSELRLMADLEMMAGEPEREVVMILTMCTTAARGADIKDAERHVLAALAMLGEWARKPRTKALYPKYTALITKSGHDA
jgi:hypothetical protein